MIIVVGGTKGGTGKSTLVTNLAAIDLGKGFDSILVDADRQGSASAWASVREETNNDIPRVPTIQKFGQLALTNELKALAKKYYNVFVDAGGYDSEELRASMLAADKILVPLKPAQFDVWTLPRIIEIISQSQLYNPNLRPYFVINGAHTNPSVKEVEDVLALAEEVEGMVFCQTVIRNRRAYVKAAAQGLGVTEPKDKDAKASEEMLRLYEEVMHG
jgi:chromosome partitioning protein